MTTPPDLSPDEPMRLQAVRRLNLTDTPLDERFERITRYAKRLLHVDIAAICLVEADRQYFKSIQGLHACETSRDVSFCGHAILGDDEFVVPDATADERFSDNPLVTGQPGIGSYASIPLRSPDGFKVGTLCVIGKSARQFTPENIEDLRDLASWAQLALGAASANAVQAALIEEVSAEHRRALIDPLTRLWNRDGIERLCDEQLAQMPKSRTGVAVVLIDVDGFKQVNDTNGHAAGDAVLRAVARRILSGLRESDVAGRIGGDEFLCLLSPCESEASARQIAEGVLSCVGEQPVPCGTGEIAVTASLGVCFVPPAWSGTLDELIHAADAAMYECKRGGRNGVCVTSATQRAA